jgi:hypothetical protein
MGRVVRSLLKLPAVKRVMLRLANAEAAISRQQAQLAELGGLAQRLSADEANHRALLAEVAQHMPPERRAEVEAAISEQQAQLGRMNERIQRLVADEARHRALLAEVAEHMPPARLAELEATIQGQQAELGTLTATIQTQQAELGPLNDRVQQLSVAQDGQRALLGEVAQHLPPAQRANLEATLHGQQLQLGALNATMHANQIQLTSLNEIVQRLSTEAGSQRDLLSGVSAQVPPARLASLETTMAEVKSQLDKLADAIPRLAADEAAHRAHVEPMRRRVARPYTFEQLLNREVEKASLDLAINIHIPKACGNTTNSLFRQIGFSPIALDMNRNDFFHTIREDRWLEGYLAPPPRESYLLTGHLRLDQPIFRRVLTPYVIVTILRDPIDRMVSHYNFTTRTPGTPWYDDVVTKGMSFVDYAAKIYSAIGPQYSFFDETGHGTFAPTGTATPEECFDNLVTRVGLYGLADRFDEFAVLTGYLFGRPEILGVAPANVTKDLPDLHQIPLKTSLSKVERNAMTKLLEGDIWFYRKAREEYERRLSDPRLQTVLSETLPLFKSCETALGRLLAMKDPGDPNRRAFERV